MSSLPSLGPRGEGWVILQVALLAAIVLSGLLASGAAGSVAPLLRVAGLASMVAGAALLAKGTLDLGRSMTPTPMPRSDGDLVERGAYRLVRHPMYGGLLLTAFGWALANGSVLTLLLAIVLAVFFDLKARREEAWLVVRYPDYREYRQRTKRLIPWVY